MFAEPVRDPGHPGPDLLQVEVSSDEQALDQRVIVTGELDMLSATALQETVSDVLRRCPSRVEIDLRAVSFLDSAGIRALLMCHADAARVDCEVILVDPHPWVYRVLEITGLLDHFHLTAEPAACDG